MLQVDPNLTLTLTRIKKLTIKPLVLQAGPANVSASRTFDYEEIVTKMNEEKPEDKLVLRKLELDKDLTRAEKTELREFLHKRSKIGKINERDLSSFARLLGSGAFGSVFVVVHQLTNTELAKKIVLWQSETNEKKDAEEKMRGVIVELNVLAWSLCPYIIGYYDSYKIGQELHMLVEYMQLGSFMSILIKTNRIPEFVLAKVAKSVL